MEPLPIIDIHERNAQLHALMRELDEAIFAGALTPTLMQLMKQIEETARLPDECIIRREPQSEFRCGTVHVIGEDSVACELAYGHDGAHRSERRRWG